MQTLKCSPAAVRPPRTPKFPPAGNLTSATRIFLTSTSRPSRDHFRPSQFWLLNSGSCALKYIFWKNEAKLCPSLLGFSKKQSQIEPKTNPKKAQTNPLKPKKRPERTQANPKIGTVGPSQMVSPAQLIAHWILLLGASLDVGRLVL